MTAIQLTGYVSYTSRKACILFHGTLASVPRVESVSLAFNRSFCIGKVRYSLIPVAWYEDSG